MLYYFHKGEFHQEFQTKFPEEQTEETEGCHNQRQPEILL